MILAIPQVILSLVRRFSTSRCRIFVYLGSVGSLLIPSKADGLPCVVHYNHIRHMPGIAAFSATNTGYACARGGAEGLANVIAGLIDNLDELERFSRKYIDITESIFNTQSIANNFINLIERVI